MSRRKRYMKTPLEDKKHNDSKTFDDIMDETVSSVAGSGKDEENRKKTLKKRPKLDVIDKAVVQIKRNNPKLTLNGVANKIKDIGLVKSRQTIYRRYRKNDYLQREFAEVQAHEDERLLRQTGPKAVDQIDLVLTKGKVKRGPGKYEDVDARTIVDTAKHVSKHHWGERVRNQQPPAISIGVIKFVQQHIQNSLSERSKTNEAEFTEVKPIEDKKK